MYLGHSCFQIDWNGLKIVTDPYNKDSFGPNGYGPQNVEAHIVTMSHHHDDHNYTGDLRGNFTVIDKPGHYTENKITIDGLMSVHDNQGGSQRGQNIIFKMTDGTITLAHLGDLGRPLSEEEKEFLAGTNILLVPVGGFFTIDAKEAFDVAQTLKPNVVIPMHYKVRQTQTWPITGVEEFTNLWPSANVKTQGSEIVVSELPRDTEVWVLRPCR
ncbi:MBL fold metallo-hydrolase [Coprothermobacter platensis]|uniref:MBL fold metallo-hydrolase n=1 Tax=Coprothermobacter platensis TaxID=108819 RepID=UPI001FE01155|nr:MBL fold metallo-hydrolase [Coprothermobacter platensis]